MVHYTTCQLLIQKRRVDSGGASRLPQGAFHLHPESISWSWYLLEQMQHGTITICVDTGVTSMHATETHGIVV